MSSFKFVVFSIFSLILKPTGAFPQSGLDLRGRRTQRDVLCRANLEYLYGNICCLNCPAGTYVKSPCTGPGELGKCEDCDYGTYTEHASGFNQCFKCTQCRSDQEILRQCSHTQDTECQCKSGRFCAPDQACEVCKKCSRCKKDEEVVRNCTPTTNTECKKIQAVSTSPSASTVLVPLVLILAGVISVIVGCWWKKRCQTSDSQRRLPDERKPAQHYTDNCSTEERKNGERPSFSNWQPEEEQFPKLVPVNGEMSLRKCFEYFEEMEVDYHKRFFRHLGISDNVIKSKESLTYEDKIHDLLNIWMEKVGREASLNDLLKTLLDLNQRRTAETVKEKAIHDGHYLEC
ncbi:hematopoietic death receptor isoform X2 [Trachinotus anak]|uniref:hematopoietic death receptor isoform X2 n=1 Tax=Trachinotus anak TaxID=443729 RepID=UPI0039F1C2A3